MTQATNRKPVDPMPPRQETPPQGYDEKVIVACKLPFAWVELQCERSREITEEGKFGSKTVTIWEKAGDIVRVRGTAYPAAQPPKGFIDRPEMLFGFAITRDVSKKFWDEFAAQKADWPPMRSGAIFAFKDSASVKAKASELRNLTTGFEPMNPDKDDRNPKPVMGNVSQISTEEERARSMPGR